MTRKKKRNSESNSFVAAAEQVCLQPVLEHRQRRGRRNIHQQAIPYIEICFQIKYTEAISSDSTRKLLKMFNTRNSVAHVCVCVCVCVCLCMCQELQRAAISRP